MSLQGIVREQQGRAVPGVHLDLRNAFGAHYETLTGAEGIFRLRDVELGIDKVTLTKPGFKTVVIPRLELNRRELSTLELQMQAAAVLAPENTGPSGLPGGTPAPAPPTTPYPPNGPTPSHRGGIDRGTNPSGVANFSPARPLGHCHARLVALRTAARCPT